MCYKTFYVKIHCKYTDYFCICKTNGRSFMKFFRGKIYIFVFVWRLQASPAGIRQWGIGLCNSKIYLYTKRL